MDIDDIWVPMLLQCVRDSIRYHQRFLESDLKHPNTEDREEGLFYLNELKIYLVDEYKKNQDRFKHTPEEVLGEVQRQEPQP